MVRNLLIAVVVLVVLVVAGLWVLGSGWLGEPVAGGEVTEVRRPDRALAESTTRQAQSAEALGVHRDSQILFGDLHVHSTFSLDAFMMSLPLAGGDGAYPVSDACDFARHCSALDFWSINDHALALTPERWRETVRAMRDCAAVSGPDEQPDLVPFLGWEWTQIGTEPANHYGHKNVVLRGLADDEIPTRPIAASLPTGVGASGFPTLPLGLYAFSQRDAGGLDFARYLQDSTGVTTCPSGVPVRELPDDCREGAPTPAELFAKLDDWGHDALVIPHGTAWGFYTPPGSSWDKQLTPEEHDPERQRLVEVFSGHGNSEEYRSYREVEYAADGARVCPEPSDDHEPSCWRAGEIIRGRCAAAGHDTAECDARAAEARAAFVAADSNAGSWTVPDAEPSDWLDAGQCRDCFQPAFNHRPLSSVQYMMALSRPGAAGGDPLRFGFGFIASSDNHSARPGTGYKEIERSTFTEARFGNFTNTPLGWSREADDPARARRFDPDDADPFFAIHESERQASFFLNGGLVAVHAQGRSRDAIFDALQRREVYGTSGPRILLWFDLINAPGTRRNLPMGSSAELRDGPIFEVRALGSLEQKPGCPAHASAALGTERSARLCRDECYHPSDTRRSLARIEVVRIRPQRSAAEPVDDLIDDPWRVYPCPEDPGGCRVVFSDPEYAASGRDALYYVRAVETPSLAVGADPLRCERDDEGRCVGVRPCFAGEPEDDCLSPTEERAWSSPIFVEQPAARGG